MKCILCGAELVEIYREPTIVVGYYCPNCIDKEGNQLQWSLSEHKDNQNWAIRHIRLLEQENANLKTKLENLIQQLEIALGTDLDGSN
jgi:hypothetical protein